MERFLKRTARIVDGQIGETSDKGLRLGTVRRIDEWSAMADVLGPGGTLTQRYVADRHTGEIRRVL
ncbi:MAG: hypothetical protein IH626_11190 [Rhodospirillales bacterium]|jgi:hypothetical protein|nr:hypothetical protein [Rhodospirillales bacterium]